MSYSIDNERFHLRLDDVNYIYESVKNVIISDIKFFFHVYNYKILFKMKYDMTCSINFKRLNRRANVQVLFNLFVKFWMILNSWEINHFICNDLILYIHACFWWLAAVSNISSFVIGQVFFIDKFVHRNKHLGKEKICLKLSFENHQLFPKYYDNITTIIIKFNNLQ